MGNWSKQCGTRALLVSEVERSLKGNLYCSNVYAFSKMVTWDYAGGGRAFVLFGKKKTSLLYSLPFQTQQPGTESPTEKKD